MKKATLEDVQARLSEYVQASAKQPVLILRGRKPVAILVGLDQDEKEAPRKLRELLKHAWKDYDEHGGTSHEQFWEDLERETSGRKPSEKR